MGESNLNVFVVVFTNASSTTSKHLPPPLQFVSIPVPVKLTYETNEELPSERETNYLLWKSFFIPILKYHDMLDLAEGRELCPPKFLDNNEVVIVNPAYTDWIKRDQLLLAWINASLTESLLLRFAGGCTSGRALWLSLENLLAEKALKHLKSRIENLKISTNKWQPYSSSLRWIADEAKEIADKLNGAGSSIDDDKFASCVMSALARSECDELIKCLIWPRPKTREQWLCRLKTYQLPTYLHTRKSTCLKICGEICTLVLLVICVIIILSLVYILETAVLSIWSPTAGRLLGIN